MTSVIIIYGSTGGNTEMVAETVADFLKEKKVRVDVKRAEQSTAKDLLKYDVCILASPTYGHGLLQEHMAKFMKGIKDIDLKGKPCAVIGLGDPKYEMQYHIESAPILEKKLTGAGGKILLPALRISRTPVMHLKGIIPHWTKQLINLII
ncbi:flavodoxin domain-containing protein [Patescibacteria group bacterium]|nr:flavodoxin domain-containing protein [Patescibacteria group bacterium]